MVNALEARGLSYDYAKGVRGVEGVDLCVAPGELVCVIGPNGSGKSSLLKLMGGLLVPDRGDVRLEGRPLSELASRERALGLATVPQSLRPFPDVGVEAFVAGGRYAHRSWFSSPRAGDGAAVRKALEEADALDWSDRTVGELSGGQFQRVLVARALAQEARVLLFDEPTVSLDPEHVVRVFELIRRLTRDGRAALLATHELALAGRYADRILLLAEGRVRAEGAPDAVLCRSVLEPVYGKDLFFGRAPGPVDRPVDCPVVYPWPRDARP